MQISLNWLKDYINLDDVNPYDLGLKFTMSSAEIEGVKNLGEDYQNVVTAKILDIQPHPNAESIRLTTVDNGKELMEVVCGGKNIEIGQIIPLAQIGAVLPGDFKIKESKIRGVTSKGMLCSEKELGLAEDAQGILILPEDTKVGIPFSSLVGKDDYIIEIDNKSLTHRPDLWGHYGIAREISAILQKEFKALDFSIPKADSEEVSIDVKIEDPDLCYRYTALAFKNIEIKESPKWLKERLLNTGNKPINNIVDATNYVMFELGQPLHSFDGDKLHSDSIIIRRAKEGEQITTLDGSKKDLSTDMLVIADKDKAIALAGVMGGENTEVDENTNYVVLESASFNAGNIRRTALKVNSRTEASARFEKSLDPELTTMAISRFYQIIKETCPDVKVVSKLVDVDYSKKEPIYIEITRDFINRRLGTNLEKEFIENTLKNLGFELKEIENERYKVKVPTYRATKDVGIPEDLVEEIGRIYGYDNIIPEAIKLDMKPIDEQPIHLIRKELRNIFSIGFSFNEVFNYSFNGSKQVEKLGLKVDDHIAILNPLSQDHEFLRTSLVPNMLDVVSKNLKNYTQFSIYEIGKVFIKEDSSEKEYICAMYVDKKPSSPLFYTAKSFALEALDKLELADFDLRVPTSEDSLGIFYHPSRTAVLNQRRLTLGVVSEIHPKILQKFDINARVAIILLDVDSLLSANKRKGKFKELQKYPTVPFDISVLVDKKVLVADVQKIIQDAGKQFIKDINLFDIYEGKNIPEDKKSLAFTINFYSKDRTLESKEITDLQNKVMKALDAKAYQVRSN